MNSSGKSKNQNRTGNTSDLALIFSVSVIALTLIYIFIMLVTRSSNYEAYFHSDRGDTAMDFFNMLYNVHLDDPYWDYSNYPPLVFLFLQVIHHFIPFPEEGWFGGSLSLRTDSIAQICYIAVSLVCIITISEVLKKLASGRYRDKLLFSTALILSGPMVFLYERGNVLLWALVFSLLFYAFYDSEDVKLRYLAYVSLAIAASIKFYPALLGLLVLKKKRYKEAIVLVILGLVFFILPFFYYDGINSFFSIVKGFSEATRVQTVNQGYGINFCYDNLMGIIGAFMGYGKVRVLLIGKVILTAVLVFGCLGTKKEWERLFAIISLCIWIPTFSYTYVLTFLILPIVSFFFSEDNKEVSLKNYIVTFLFVFTMIPYALPTIDSVNRLVRAEVVHYPVSWGQLIIYFCIIALDVIVVADAVCNIRKKMAERKVL